MVLICRSAFSLFRKNIHNIITLAVFYILQYMCSQTVYMPRKENLHIKFYTQICIEGGLNTATARKWQNKEKVLMR